MDRRLLDRSLAYVDSWLAWRCRRTEIPGCAVAVSHKGRLVFSAAYGKADLESGKKLGPEAVFRIASHSKSFTATALLQLVEQGRLRLDDPVASHLGWMSDHKDSRMRRVSVRQLLCHGAGVIRDGVDADYWQLARPFPDRDELRQWVLGGSLVTEPNVALKYSNIGYGLLGLVVEELSGQEYARYVEEHILSPLDLGSTVAEPARDTSRAVTGYSRRGPDGARQPIPHVDTAALAPATGFASTAPEICRYFTAHFVGSKKLLGDEMKREMQRVHWKVHRPSLGEQEYALGLMLQRVGERSTFGHGGGFPGQITHTMAAPADELVVTALTSCIDGPAVEIVRGIYGVIDHFQRAAGKPNLRGIQALAGRYVNLWSAVDLVVAGDEITAATPDSWSPLAEPDKLERVDGRTLRIADTNSFGSPGELVSFEVSDGEVRSVRWGGTTCWPEAAWPAAEKRLLRQAGRRRRT